MVESTTIILWTELFPRRGERRSKERFFNLSSSTVVFPHFYKNYTKSNIPTSFPVIPCYSTYRINSSPRTTRLIPYRSLQGIFQQLLPVHPSILHGRIQSEGSLQHSRAIQHKQASNNSTR